MSDIDTDLFRSRICNGAQIAGTKQHHVGRLGAKLQVTTLYWGHFKFMIYHKIRLMDHYVHNNPYNVLMFLGFAGNKTMQNIMTFNPWTRLMSLVTVIVWLCITNSNISLCWFSLLLTFPIIFFVSCQFCLNIRSLWRFVMTMWEEGFAQLISGISEWGLALQTIYITGLLSLVLILLLHLHRHIFQVAASNSGAVAGALRSRLMGDCCFLLTNCWSHFRKLSHFIFYSSCWEYIF